ncbi:MAG: alanine racemase [Polyangiaceae bacterium]
MTQPLVPRILRPRRAAPAEAIRPTRAEINLGALRHNARVLRKHAGGSQLWAVMKADAYGHGAPAVARTLERAGVDGFCVALLEEGVELREAGIVAPILVMGGHYGTAHEEALARGLTPVVHDLSAVAAFARLVRSGSVPGPVDVHLKVDTGMARLGATLRELPELATELADTREVRVCGLMTHLACADAAECEPVLEQMRLLDEASAILACHGIRPRLRHAANSAALLRGHGLLDAVRPGLALFGVSPRIGSQALTADIKPVMRVRSEVVALREVEEGASVGYGSTWRADRRSRIATVPIGYADGLSRRAGNRGQVLVRGRRAPVVGAVSMDMTMVDVSEIDGASLGDEVVILGSQDSPLGRASIGADEMAATAETIPWEVLTSISRRVPRFYREP